MWRVRIESNSHLNRIYAWQSSGKAVLNVCIRRAWIGRGHIADRTWQQKEERRKKTHLIRSPLVLPYIFRSTSFLHLVFAAFIINLWLFVISTERICTSAPYLFIFFLGFSMIFPFVVFLCCRLSTSWHFRCVFLREFSVRYTLTRALPRKADQFKTQLVVDREKEPNRANMFMGAALLRSRVSFLRCSFAWYLQNETVKK